MSIFTFFLCLASSCSRETGSRAENVTGDSDVETHISGAVDDSANRLCKHIVDALDDRRLAAQVIITGIDGRGELNQDMRILLTECPAGGIMLFRYNLDTDNDSIRRMITAVSGLIVSESSVGILPGEASGIPQGVLPGVPPFVAADHEGGPVNRFRRGVADLPPPFSYWEAARDRGENTVFAQIAADSFYAGKTLGGLGVNLNFAPVAEHLTQNNSAFLEDRSYGPEPVFAANAASAFIAGMELAGVLCSVKHFPGSSGADPHYFSSVLRGDTETVNKLASPFEFLVRNGTARAIMVSHSLVPSRDGVNIASLSPAILENWLRLEWGFEGIIISDDFSMASAGGRAGSRPETLAVRSLAAGADMVLVWPPDLRRTHREIQAALNDGRLSRERLREAAGRILSEKIRMGLIAGNG